LTRIFTYATINTTPAIMPTKESEMETVVFIFGAVLLIAVTRLIARVIKQLTYFILNTKGDNT